MVCARLFGSESFDAAEATPPVSTLVFTPPSCAAALWVPAVEPPLPSSEPRKLLPACAAPVAPLALAFMLSRPASVV
ncbi:hypothetical protein ASF32_19275 [Methylobacterium sp. Leaf91]|nr:hypothetical protein ASF32_19275 [Methylobacterium sp. Leaf91]